MHRDNSCATQTAVTDGNRIYAWFGNEGLFCCNFNGDILWSQKDLPFDSIDGVVTSPLLDSGLVIIQSESSSEICHAADSYVTALDAATGTTAWKVERPPSPFPSGNCRTPLIRVVQGRKPSSSKVRRNCADSIFIRVKRFGTPIFRQSAAIRWQARPPISAGCTLREPRACLLSTLIGWERGKIPSLGREEPAG